VRAAHAASGAFGRARPHAVRVFARRDRHLDFGAANRAAAFAPGARRSGMTSVPGSSFPKAALCLVALLAAARPALAALPEEGQPILSNDYGIDLYQGPVLSANRVIGLAGAFV